MKEVKGLRKEVKSRAAYNMEKYEENKSRAIDHSPYKKRHLGDRCSSKVGQLQKRKVHLTDLIKPAK